MSQKDHSNESDNDLPASGDSPQQVEIEKEIPDKKSTPPPVRPRPQTARGLRPPVRKPPNAATPATNSPNAGRFGSDQQMEELECKSSGKLRNAMPESQNRSSNLPSTSSSGNSQTRQIHRKGGSRTFVDQVTDEERKVGDQGRLFMNMFIVERAASEHTLQEPIIREVCPADRSQAERAGFSDEALTDFAATLRKIGDDISENVELNNFIDQVPYESTKDIFVKVCLKIFENGDMNWGRVVALFYFAYRLVVRALSKGIDSVPWVREMLHWAGDFLVKHVAKWVISRGGWKMIKEWFGPSNRTWMLLFFASMTFGLWAYFIKE